MYKKTIYVKGYTRKDGTQVKSHNRNLYLFPFKKDSDVKKIDDLIYEISQLTYDISDLHAQTDKYKKEINEMINEGVSGDIILKKEGKLDSNQDDLLLKEIILENKQKELLQLRSKYK